MTNPSKPKSKDNSFSTFAVGVSVGVAASLLFGTEEGRNLVKRVMDAIPEKYKQVPDLSVISSSAFSPRPDRGVVKRSHSTQHQASPIIPTQETSHHTTFNPSSHLSASGGRNTSWQSHSTESPPPPPPAVRPSRPELFHPR